MHAQYDITDTNTEEEEVKEPKINWFDIKQKTYVGGDISARFGNLTYVYASPMIGYDFYKKMSVGVSGIYQLLYLSNGVSSQSEHTIGGGIFFRYRPIDFLILQTEFDLLNTVNYTSAPGNRINVPVFMFGAGYAGMLGDRAYYSLMLMFDFIDNENMPVPKLIPGIPLYYRAGFAFYLG